MNMHNKIRWTSPSNIAIVKYWGKKGMQIPMNPSLSFTLSECKTDTSIEWLEEQNKAHCKVEFYYNGNPKPEFEEKINKYISLLESDMPWLQTLHLKINSLNTFPHSAGIASSASAMSALALCLVTHEQEILHQRAFDDSLLKKASFVARLGSGSAARSVYPMASVWGLTEQIPGSSDEFAIPFGDEIHPVFQNLEDCIFIVNQNEKSVSSRAGHKLMEQHPFRESRIHQANTNLRYLIQALKGGDWLNFASVCEEEALSLHGLMMTSNPGYILLEPESLFIISELKKFRSESKLPVTFTIDAGPNIHLLYPENIKEEVKSWIQKELPVYWNERKLIFDRIGNGPERIK
jgi:diphosphomevalonate decarboxylase